MPFGLKAFDLSAETRRLELPEVSADRAAPIVLVMHFAGGLSKRVLNFRFKQPEAPEPPADEDRAARWLRQQTDTATLLGGVSLVAWEHVLEDDAPVECTPDAATRFLLELLEHRPDVFTRVSTFALTPGNFATAVETPTVDGVDLGKE